MKIAILGGAFDPPHMGHYLVAQQVKEKLHMDQIWFMPCYTYFSEWPVKFSHISLARARYQMAKLCEEDGSIVSDFEFKYNKESRTINTLRLLEKRYGQHEFFWIIGSDTLETFGYWHEWKELVQCHNLVIFPRDTDYKTLEDRVKKSMGLSCIPKNITIIEGDVIVSDISSSLIRRRIRAGLPIKYIVSKKVEQFIKKNKLYVKT